MTTPTDAALAKAFNEAARDWNSEAHWHVVRDAIAARAREIDAQPGGDAVDAARYRWLRDYNTQRHPKVTHAFYLGAENLDAAIDAAMTGGEHG